MESWGRAGRHRTKHKVNAQECHLHSLVEVPQNQTQGECPGVPPALSHMGCTPMTPLKLTHFTKTSPLNAIVGLSFYPLNISQWGFKVHTWTWEDRLKLHSNSSGNATLYIFCTRKESQQHFEKCMTLTDIFLIKKNAKEICWCSLAQISEKVKFNWCSEKMKW